MSYKQNGLFVTRNDHMAYRRLQPLASIRDLPDSAYLGVNEDADVLLSFDGVRRFGIVFFWSAVAYMAVLLLAAVIALLA